MSKSMLYDLRVQNIETKAYVNCFKQLFYKILIFFFRNSNPYDWIINGEVGSNPTHLL